MDFVRPVEAIVPGAQGRVLAVLSRDHGGAEPADDRAAVGGEPGPGVRVLPALVELGVVERREVPPSSLFRIVREHVATRAILALARSTDTVLDELGEMAKSLPVPPESVIVFGSFARHEAGIDSDIDMVVVRPSDVDEDDERWAASVEQWRAEVRRLTGNPVEMLEVSIDEARSRLRGRSPLWTEIGRAGRVVHGASLDELRLTRHG